jgi:hypothetical protein
MMAYASWSVVFGEQPSAAKWNILGTNDSAFNDGTGLPMNNAASAYVATAETTTSTTYTDLATVTDTVTVTIGATGRVLVGIKTELINNTANAWTYATFAASGANTIAAADKYSVKYQAYGANAANAIGAPFLITGLVAGSTTFKMKFRVQTGGGGSGTGQFVDRHIFAVPL